MSVLALRARRGRPSRPDVPLAVLGVLALVLGGIAGRLAVSHYGKTMVELFVAAVVIALVSGVVTRRPPLAVAAIVAALVLVPVDSAPVVQHLTMHPMLALSAIVAVALVLRSVSGRIRLSLIDYCVLGMVVIMWLAVALGPRTWKDALNQMWLWLPPYLAGRVIAARRPLNRTLAVSVVLGGLALVPFTIAEVLGLGSPFFGGVSDNPAASPWSQPHVRAGEAFRVQASFGHPIAYSMFLAVAIVFALVLFSTSTERRRRRQYLLATGLLLVSEALTLSRTGWVVLGVTLLLLGAGRARRNVATRAARRAVGAALAVLVVAALAVPSVAAVPLSIVGLQSDTTDQALNASTSYRADLYTAAFNQGVASWWGNANSKLSNTVESANSSVDSNYLVLLDSWGALFTLAFLAVVLSVAGKAIADASRESDEWSPTFSASAAGLAAGLASVALITQTEYFVWLVIGLAAVPRGATPLVGTPDAKGRWRFAEAGLALTAAVKTNGALIKPALRRYWWVTVVSAAVAGAVTVAIPRLSGKHYEATSAVLFETPQIDRIFFGHTLFQTGDVPHREAVTRQQLASLPVIAQRTARQLGLPVTKVQADMTVAEVKRSDLYAITAKDRDPRLTVRLANAYAQQFLAEAKAQSRADLQNAYQVVSRRLAQMPAAAHSSADAAALRRSLHDLAFTASLQTGNVEMIQPANLPTGPTATKKKTIGYGAALGLLVGLLLIAIVARRERRLTDVESLEDVMGAPVLASVPALGPASDPFVRTSLPERGVDVFGLLRGRLHHLAGRRTVRSLLVTSSQRGDGRSTVAFELAVAEAVSGHASVVLVEADLRSPYLHTALFGEPGPGLADVLSGGAELEEALCSVDLSPRSSSDTAGSTLTILPAGAIPPNPSELLESRSMAAVLAELLERFDMVVIDAPPLGVVADALALAGSVDGVLAVARPDELRRADAAALRDRLRGAGAHLVGVVTNAAGQGRRLRAPGRQLIAR